MNALSIENSLHRAAAAAIGEATAVAVPAGANPAGLSGWLRATALETLEQGKTTTEVVARSAWGFCGPSSSVARRFHGARLKPPAAFIRAYRAAAIGVLCSEGADPLRICNVLDLSSVSNVYKTVERVEAAVRGRRFSARKTGSWVLAKMRAHSRLWAFNRYVRPLLPAAGDRRWRLAVIPGIDRSSNRRR